MCTGASPGSAGQALASALLYSPNLQGVFVYLQRSARLCARPWVSAACILHPGAQREREAEEEARRAEQEKAAAELAKVEALRAELLQEKAAAAEPAPKPAVRALACSPVCRCAPRRSSLCPSCACLAHAGGLLFGMQSVL